MIPRVQHDFKELDVEGESYAFTETSIGLRVPDAPGLWLDMPDGSANHQFIGAVHTGLPVLLERSGELEAAVCTRLAVVLG